MITIVDRSLEKAFVRAEEFSGDIVRVIRVNCEWRIYVKINRK